MRKADSLEAAFLGRGESPKNKCRLVWDLIKPLCAEKNSEQSKRQKDTLVGGNKVKRRKAR